MLFIIVFLNLFMLSYGVYFGILFCHFRAEFNTYLSLNAFPQKSESLTN